MPVSPPGRDKRRSRECDRARGTGPGCVPCRAGPSCWSNKPGRGAGQDPALLDVTTIDASARGAQMRNRVSREQKRRLEVRVHHGVPFRFANVGDLFHKPYAGIRDHDIEPAMPPAARSTSDSRRRLAERRRRSTECRCLAKPRDSPGLLHVSNENPRPFPSQSRAVARPMPLAPPVTMATRPAKSHGLFPQKPGNQYS